MVIYLPLKLPDLNMNTIFNDPCFFKSKSDTNLRCNRMGVYLTI